MRIRSIKPEFWRSDDIDALDWHTRLVFIGLWSYVDDNGVGLDKLASICADLFAGDLERDPRETFARVGDALELLSARGLIERYTVDGKAYLFVPGWKKHQRVDRPNKPRFPMPTSENAVPRETLATSSRDSRDSPATGTGEQGNRGTGEKESCGAVLNVSNDRARDDDEAPRGPVVDSQGWKIVRDEIPDEHPHAVRTDLAIRAGALLKSGTTESDVRAALALWLGKPNLGPGVLPSLVSEVVRTRSPSSAAPAEGAATTKARGWLAVGDQLARAQTALPTADPKAIR